MNKLMFEVPIDNNDDDGCVELVEYQKPHCAPCDVKCARKLHFIHMLLMNN